MSLPVDQIPPAPLPALFVGGRLAVVGRYPRGGPVTATLTGSRLGETVTFRSEAVLASGPVEGGELVARLWAVGRLADLLQKIDDLDDSDLGSEAE